MLRPLSPAPRLAAMGPVIGLTLDSEPPGGYAKLPWYAIRENYCDAVSAAGGIPVALPHDVEQVPAFLDLIDGLLITGGAFDVDPALFGAASRHPTVVTKDRRTAFEYAITRGAMARDMAIFGICGGQQLLNVVLAGSLIQDIASEVPDALAHEQPNPRTEPGHRVTVTAGSLLHRIVECDELAVNSAHHQAAAKVAPEITVNAVAGDGIIEGIEDPRLKFCLGVQWHPEYDVSSGDHRLFAAFVSAAAA